VGVGATPVTVSAMSPVAAVAPSAPVMCVLPALSALTCPVLLIEATVESEEVKVK
jgi:hypothetical protein